jgi:hypothetical protein
MRNNVGGVEEPGLTLAVYGPTSWVRSGNVVNRLVRFMNAQSEDGEPASLCVDGTSKHFTF